MNDERLRVFEDALSAMAEFKRAFGRGLDSAFVAELYAEKELGVEICVGSNMRGFDARDPNGQRYQIKFRNAQNVDVNNFDFDCLVLVNVDDDYRLVGMWRMTAAQAREVFTWRESGRRYQATQDRIKSVAERIR